MLLAFAAADAVAWAGVVLADAGDHEVFRQRFPVAVGGAAVVGGEGAGDIHAPGAGHAVPAAGAADLHLLVDGRHHPAVDFKIRLRQAIRPGGVRRGHVLPHHLQGIHAGEHAGHLRLVPQPLERPLGRGAPTLRMLQHMPGCGWQAAGEPSAPQRLHDDHGQSLFRRPAQAGDPRLGVFVQVVILDLAEVPVVDLQELAEHIGIAVIGEAHLADLPGPFLLFQPGQDAQAHQPVPGLYVREHVHQVIVHVVRFQAAQLLGKILLHALRLLDQVVGELGGDVHLFPDAVAGEDLSQRRLAAVVDIGGVIVVHAGPVGLHDFLFRLVHVHLSAAEGETHAPVAQDGDGVSVSVGAVLHIDDLLGSVFVHYTGHVSISQQKSSIKTATFSH